MTDIDPTQRTIAVTIQGNGIIRLATNGHMIGSFSDDRCITDPDVEEAIKAWNTRPDGWVSVDDRLPKETAQILSPPSTAQDAIAVEKSIYKLIARNYHLPEDFVEGSAQAESGVAIKLRNQELQNERIGDIIRWRNFEHEIYKIERDILSKAGVSVSEEFAVDFSETTEYLSEDEQRAKDDWDLEHNLTTIVDIAMRENPDLTREDAEALIEANKETNATPAESGLANILGTPPE